MSHYEAFPSRSVNFHRGWPGRPIWGRRRNFYSFLEDSTPFQLLDISSYLSMVNSERQNTEQLFFYCDYLRYLPHANEPETNPVYIYAHNKNVHCSLLSFPQQKGWRAQCSLSPSSSSSSSWPRTWPQQRFHSGQKCPIVRYIRGGGFCVAWRRYSLFKNLFNTQFGFAQRFSTAATSTLVHYGSEHIGSSTMS